MITNAKVDGTAIVRITQLKVTPEWNVQIADCYHTVIIRVMSTTLTELTLKYARMDIRIKQFAKIM